MKLINSMRIVANVFKLIAACFVVRSLEIELHDRIEAAREVTLDQIPTIRSSLRQTRRELAVARGKYRQLLGDISPSPASITQA